MKLRALVLAAALGASIATIAHAEPDPVVVKAMAEKKLGFCKTPTKPIMGRRKDMCSLAVEVDGCEAYTKDCKEPEPPPSWLTRLAEIMGPLAHVLLYVIVIVIVLAIAIPVIRALLRLRRDKQIADVEKGPSVATVVAPPPPPEEITDAESALREAEHLRARGDFGRALALYLGASLAALDRRGAVRIAKHRTNGEYVRSCTDAAARQPLREIVREVDKVEFGKIPPAEDAVARVASRATSLVKAVVVTGLVLLVAGCNGASNGNDPVGDELPQQVLRENGWKVAPLTRSIASLPIDSPSAPEKDSIPILVVDVERVTMEEEAEAHLMRWVEHGGILVVFGPPTRWPKELAAKTGIKGTRDVTVGPQKARLAHPATVEWSGAVPIARSGEGVHAGWKVIGSGAVLGVASGDLFTNIGMMPRHNAEALQLLFEYADDSAAKREIRVARAEDGIPPPSSPFAAIVAAGLGKGAWHALAASILLFLAYGIRHARARPAAVPARRAFTEHVEATGAFYDRTRVFAHALAAYGRFVELRLRERIPRGADPAAFLAARSGADPEKAARIYERATKAKSDDATAGDELAAIKELRTMLVKSLDAS